MMNQNNGTKFVGKNNSPIRLPRKCYIKLKIINTNKKYLNLKKY